MIASRNFVDARVLKSRKELGDLVGAAEGILFSLHKQHRLDDVWQMRIPTLLWSAGWMKRIAQ